MPSLWGLLETTFRVETETDLFGEQAVLCGGVSKPACISAQTPDRKSTVYKEKRKQVLINLPP